MRKREQQALEEGWTVEERADKDAEVRDKLNAARSKCVWILAAGNVVMAGLLGFMFHLGMMLEK